MKGLKTLVAAMAVTSYGLFLIGVYTTGLVVRHIRGADRGRPY